MSDYDNSNRISLWLNDRREKATQPILTGNGETNEPVWANAWFDKELPDSDKRTLMDILKRHNQTTKRPFISISLKAKREPQAPAAEPAAAGGFEDDLGVPF